MSTSTAVTKVKLIQVGNSLGATFSKEVLARMKVERGDTLYLTETADGYRITPYDPKLAARNGSWPSSHARASGHPARTREMNESDGPVQPKWIGRAVAVALHDEQIAEHGGLSRIRDEGLLELSLGPTEEPLAV